MNILERMAGFNLSSFAGSSVASIEGDRLVGEMSEPLRRIYGLWLDAFKKMEDIKVEYAVLSLKSGVAEGSVPGAIGHTAEAPTAGMLSEVEARFNKANAEQRALYSILAAATKLEFPELLESQDIYFAEGFKVMECKNRGVPFALYVVRG